MQIHHTSKYLGTTDQVLGFIFVSADKTQNNTKSLYILFVILKYLGSNESSFAPQILLLLHFSCLNGVYCIAINDFTFIFKLLCRASTYKCKCIITFYTMLFIYFEIFFRQVSYTWMHKHIYIKILLCNIYLKFSKVTANSLFI